MKGFPPSEPRRLLPRLKPVRQAIRAGELASTQSRDVAPTSDAYFDDRKAEWANAREYEIALELVASAITLNRETEVQDAAQIVAEMEDATRGPIWHMAARALGWNSQGTTGTPLAIRGNINRVPIYSEIGRLRHLTETHPRNAYAWTELARNYAILGQRKQADRTFSIALALTPNDRFVVRSAARYFVHAGEIDRSLSILRKCAAIKSDPWVMSAEIAVSSVAGFTAKSTALAKRELQKAAWPRRSSAELQGSLATLLLEDGSSVSARKFFRKSLEDPTENAVAQAQWAANKTTGLIIPTSALSLPDSFEANALRSWAAGNWSDAIDNCWQWAELEPTSTRPMALGSYIAGVANEDGDVALAFSLRGLDAEPENVMFHNNKAVALAYQGRTDSAFSALRNAIDRKSESPEHVTVLLATLGLIYFRDGDPAAGRKYYEGAIARATGANSAGLRALALWHFAREEARIGTAATDAIALRAEDASKNIKLTEIGALRVQVDNLRRKRAVHTPPSKPERRTGDIASAAEALINRHSSP